MNPLDISVTIERVDFISTISMTVGLTIEVSVHWNDLRLTYFNIVDAEDNHEFKNVNSDVYEKLWLPIPKIIHENAVIGNIKRDVNINILINPKSKQKIDYPTSPMEEMIFSGADSDLIMIQRLKLEYICDFDLRKFPFDEQSCEFIMKIKSP